ncbi:PDZ domain-containing protein 9 [Vipera latastei]
MEDSEHTLSTTIKTNIQMDEDGLGIILIQNGPYLQVSGVVEKSAAAKDGKLQAGDILLKIGHANVLGWTLRELRQLLHTVPIGTVLQIQVYRDFIKIPSRWQTALVNIPGTDPSLHFSIESYASEENWTSSEDSENESEGKVEDSEEGSEESYQEPERERALSVGGIRSIHSFHGIHNARSIHNVRSFHGIHNVRSFHGVHNLHSFHGVHNVRSFHGVHNVRSFNGVHNVHSFHGVRNVHSVCNVKAMRSLSAEPLIHQPKWISKDWHIFERKTYTFTVGSDIGCDIMIHQDFETESEADMSTLYVSSSSPYWTMPKHKAPPSVSSSSSVSDAFWLENVSYELD